MAGFRQNEPRNKKGEWSTGALSRAYGEGRGLIPKPGYTGRPKPDYKRPKEEYGKPRQLYQHTSVKNPSAQAQPYLKKKFKHNEFSNLPTAELKRMNQNLGQLPEKMRRPNPNYNPQVLGSTKTEHALKGTSKKITRSDTAHQEKMTEHQRDARLTREALVDAVIKSPGDIHTYQINKGPSQLNYRGIGAPFGMSGPKLFNKAEKAFNTLERVTRRWWK